MSRKQRGFTLIELMIVIAIIAIIAAIAIPNLLAARLSANETAAIATLRNIVSAQAQFQQSAKADGDDDGTGEYGGFLELSGAQAGRMNAALVPPVLSGAFRVLNGAGEVSRSGYFFRIFLPGVGGAPIGETQAGYDDATALDDDLAETTWCCYAWPVNHNQSGNRTFFTNQGGDVIANEAVDAADAYSGSGAIADGNADAAFQLPAGRIDGSVALGVDAAGDPVVSNDGEVWRQVN